MSETRYICLVSDPVSQKPITLLVCDDLQSDYKQLLTSILHEHSPLAHSIQHLLDNKVIPGVTILEACQNSDAWKALADWRAHFKRRGVMLVEHENYKQDNSFNGLEVLGKPLLQGVPLPVAKNTVFWKKLGLTPFLKSSKEDPVHKSYFKSKEHDDELRIMHGHKIETDSIAAIMGFPNIAVEQRLRYLGLND